MQNLRFVSDIEKLTDDVSDAAISSDIHVYGHDSMSWYTQYKKSKKIECITQYYLQTREEGQADILRE